MNPKARQDLKWEKANENYGLALEEIKAEFQSQSLVSLRSNPIKYQNVRIGTIHMFKCNVEACDFYARVRLDLAPNSKPEVETASKLSNFFPK